MPLLFYWTREYYVRNRDQTLVDRSLDQRNPSLHDIEPGDSVWAFTRNSQKDYVLAAELVIAKKEKYPSDAPDGLYRVVGDPDRSRFFDTERQRSIERLIRRLSLRVEGRRLGNSFHGRNAVRRITEEDSAKLTEAARLLPILSMSGSSRPIDELDPNVLREITRMATLIENRISSGGELNVRINPQRFPPNASDLVAMLTAKWREQRGLCLLCGGHLVAGNENPMLQLSPDRIDSSKGAYSEENVQITHLACNLAKNKYGTSQFAEWLDVVRGEAEYVEEP